MRQMSRPAMSRRPTGHVVLAAVAAFGLAAPARAQAPAQTAHVHGAGSLAIAIEGATVQMELEAPGSDIVGFEHAPRTAAQKKALAAAKATLAKPLALVEPAAAAGCKVTTAKVAFSAGDGDDGHGHGHGHAHGKPKAAKNAPAKGEPAAKDDHAEFRATYVLTCAHIAGLTALTFPYFKAFKGADKLTVTLIAPKGQSRFDVTRDKPRLDLSGLM